MGLSCMVQGTLLGALGWPMWEGLDFLVSLAVHLRLAQHCKSTILQFKKKKIQKTKINHKSNIPSEFLLPSWVIQSALSWPQAFPAHTHTLFLFLPTNLTPVLTKLGLYF